MEPKFITKDEFKVVGMICKTTLKDNRENKSIPTLWSRFLPRLAEVKSKSKSGICYGICLVDPEFDTNELTDDTEYEYMAGTEVEDFADIPDGMTTRVVSKQKYAVFTHKGSLENLQHTYDYIYGLWVNKGGYKIARKDDFELYDHRFDAQNPEKSEFDIYVPIW